MWDSSWWRDISVLEGISILIPRLIHICTICKRYIILVCYIYMYVRIFPHRNHSANLPWTKIPPFPPAPAKRKRCEYIYIIHTYYIDIFTYLESHNVSNGFPRKVLMRKSSMLNLLKPWSRQASGARTHPGEYLATNFCWKCRCLTGMFL